jgi:hypothetical protein
MSSLAMMAASIDNNEYENSIINNNSLTGNKRHNKTIRKYNSGNTDFNPKKVSNVLESLHNRINNNNVGDDESNMKNFEPMSPPKSMTKEGFSGLSEGLGGSSEDSYSPVVSQIGSTPFGIDVDSTHDYTLTHMNNEQVNNYYKKLLPTYEQKPNTNRRYQYQPQTTSFTSSDDTLLQKVNYMINLLEEQKDERTNNVTEEVVLYCFLGVFIIFVTDSFARVGKYVR